MATPAPEITPTLKRGLDTGGEGLDATKKPKLEVAAEDMMEIRVLIDNFEASVVIGKGGENVRAVRAATGTFISVLKNDNRESKERILTIKGHPDILPPAFTQIHTLLLANAVSRHESGGRTEVPTTYTMKVLIHKFLAGSIIGKGGTIIREIQESTGAHISLSTEPIGDSTEKTVAITGATDTFAACVTRIIRQIVENPLRAGSNMSLYEPGKIHQPPPMPYGAPYGMPPPGYGAPPGLPPGGYGAPPGQYDPHQATPSNPYGMPEGSNPYAQPGMPGMPPGGAYSPYGAPPPGHHGAPSPYGAPPPGAGGPQKVEKIVIPTVCAGTVIGKGGGVITDIKRQSGTQITIADPNPTSPNDRVVTITGAPHAIQHATALIKQRVDSYDPNHVPRARQA